MEHRQLLTTIVVDTLVDEADGSISDGDVSLRDALSNADDGSEIRFDEALNGGVILLTLGQLEINNVLDIDATSLPDGITVDASGNDPTPDEDNGDGSRVLYLSPSDALQVTTISGVTITGGDVDGRGGGIGSPFYAATLRINDSTITGNSATVHGGGIAVSGGGSLEIHSSVISQNRSGDNGGGIRTNDLKLFDSVVEENEALDGGGIAGFSLIRIVRSTVSGNIATGFGGGISARYVEVEASTIAFNDADAKGGGINASIVEVSNSTISNNSAGQQGGGVIADEFEFESVTVTQNSADVGGGIFRKEDDVFEFLVRNSILAENQASSSPDFRNVVFFPFSVTSSFIGDNGGTGIAEASVANPDEDGNIVGDANGAGALSPELTSLANHGGPTLTHAPVPGSPVINMGETNEEQPLNDQRGVPFTRVSGARIDMGALEYQTAVIDYAEDEVLNCSDVDFMVGSIVAGEQEAMFDLTGDSVIDKSDVDVWLRLSGIENLPSHQAYPQGDATLDGRVDSEDLNAVGLNWQSSVNGWCAGDFDLDGTIGGGDLNIIGLQWLVDVNEPEEEPALASLADRDSGLPMLGDTNPTEPEDDVHLDNPRFVAEPLARNARLLNVATARRRYQQVDGGQASKVDSVMMHWRSLPTLDQA